MSVYIHASNVRPSVWSSTDAQFRDFVSFYINAFTNCGWVRTSDTGQIDAATVLSPGATANQTRGYAIFRMNDSLQSTNPFFIKMVFGNGSASPSTALTFSVGSGTDGAGNLTGPTSTTQTCSFAASTTATTATAAGDGSYIVIVLGQFVGYAQAVLMIDRSRNPSNGAATAAGVGILFQASVASTASSLGTWHYGWDATGPSEQASRFWVYGPPNVLMYGAGASTGINGNEVKTAGSMGFACPTLAPSNVCYALYQGDTPDYQSFSMTTMGALRTYRILPAANGAAIFRYVNTTTSDPTGGNLYDLAVRWE